MTRLTVAAVLTSAREWLQASVEAQVPLGWRVRLWSAMKREFPDDALFRRNVLSFVVAQRTIPSWNTIKQSLIARIQDVPSRLIGQCRQLIGGEISAKQAQDYHAEDDVEYAMGLFDEHGPAAWCPLAVAAAIKCASGYEEAICEEHFYRYAWHADFLDRCREDATWRTWDAHYWAACVASGFPGLPGYDPDRRRKYWLRWLDRDVPSVLGPLDEVRAFLNP